MDTWFIIGIIIISGCSIIVIAILSYQRMLAPLLQVRMLADSTGAFTKVRHFYIQSWGWAQMAERLGSRAINQKVVGSIPGRAKWRVLGQGTSPYFPLGECPFIYWKSIWIRASAKWINVNVMISNIVNTCYQLGITQWKRTSLQSKRSQAILIHHIHSTGSGPNAGQRSDRAGTWQQALKEVRLL